MPLGHRPPAGETDRAPREHAVLAAATAIVTTSAWTQKRLIELYALPAERIQSPSPASTPPSLPWEPRAEERCCAWPR